MRLRHMLAIAICAPLACCKAEVRVSEGSVRESTGEECALAIFKAGVGGPLTTEKVSTLLQSKRADLRAVGLVFAEEHLLGDANESTRVLVEGLAESSNKTERSLAVRALRLSGHIPDKILRSAIRSGHLPLVQQAIISGNRLSSDLVDELVDILAQLANSDTLVSDQLAIDSILLRFRHHVDQQRVRAALTQAYAQLIGERLDKRLRGHIFTMLYGRDDADLGHFYVDMLIEGSKGYAPDLPTAPAHLRSDAVWVEGFRDTADSEGKKELRQRRAALLAEMPNSTTYSYYRCRIVPQIIGWLLDEASAGELSEVDKGVVSVYHNRRSWVSDFDHGPVPFEVLAVIQLKSTENTQSEVLLVFPVPYLPSGYMGEDVILTAQLDHPRWQYSFSLTLQSLQQTVKPDDHTALAGFRIDGFDLTMTDEQTGTITQMRKHGSSYIRVGKPRTLLYTSSRDDPFSLTVVLACHKR